MRKKTFYAEAAYILGIAALALGTALMERADFGVSMVVAPAYLLYLKLSQAFPFVTFGMAEYTLQAVLLALLCAALGRFKIAYLFSFVTAVFYGLTLDGCMALTAFIPADDVPIRLVLFAAGMLACALGVSLLFHTYIAPEVYELAVKELSAKFGLDIVKVKTVYDCVSCLAALTLSFAFFGLWHFEGVKFGTIFCALVNGTTIGLFSRFLERRFEFRDRLKLRRYFA
jgi:uncharacterized membrane protein YczE